MRVVPALEALEDRAAGVGRGREAVAIEQLALDRREEALAHRVVVSVAGAGRATHAHYPLADPPSTRQSVAIGCRARSRSHELESCGGIGPASRANQAAVLLGISRSSGLRPARTISTSRCQYSGGYGLPDFGIVNSSSRESGLATTRPGALHLTTGHGIAQA